MASPSRVVSLFTGIAGLDLGIAAAFPRSRTVCHVEREAFAATVLAARMADGSLPPAPVWTDIGTFDAAAWRGRCDAVSAGWPCPPVSAAGKRAGNKDARWLWPQVVRVLRETGAGWFLGENVGGLLSANAGREFGEVLRDLAGLGFAAEWIVLRASDVGAPHRRERVFILANRAGRGGEGGAIPEGSRGEGRDGEAHPHGSGSRVADAERLQRDLEEASRRDGAGEPPRGAGGGVVDAERPRRQETGSRRQIDAEGKPATGCRPLEDASRVREHGQDGEDGGRGRRNGEDMADSGRERREGIIAAGAATPATEREGRATLADSDDRRRTEGRESEERDGGLHDLEKSRTVPQFPPGPGDTTAWNRILAVRPDLAPALSAKEEAQLAVRSLAGRTRPDLALPSRVDALRSCGNIVVPAQAAAAFRILHSRLTPEATR